MELHPSGTSLFIAPSSTVIEHVRKKDTPFGSVLAFEGHHGFSNVGTLKGGVHSANRFGDKAVKKVYVSKEVGLASTLVGFLIRI